MYKRIAFLRSQLGELPRYWKRVILITFDICALSFAAWAAYTLRFGVWMTPNMDQLALVLAAPLVALPVFVQFGLYPSVIRYCPNEPSGPLRAP